MKITQLLNCLPDSLRHLPRRLAAGLLSLCLLGAVPASARSPVHHRGLQLVLLEQYESETVRETARICAQASKLPANNGIVEIGGILPHFCAIPGGAPYRNLESFFLPTFFNEAGGSRVSLTIFLSFHRHDSTNRETILDRARHFDAFAHRVGVAYPGRVLLKVGFQLEDQDSEREADSLLEAMISQFTFDPSAPSCSIIRNAIDPVPANERGIRSRFEVRCRDGLTRSFATLREFHGLIREASGFQQASNDGFFVYAKRGFRYQPPSGRMTTVREAADSWPGAGVVQPSRPESIESLKKLSAKAPRSCRVIVLHRPAYNGLISGTRIEKRRRINTLLYDDTDIRDPRQRGTITFAPHEFILMSRFLGS